MKEICIFINAMDRLGNISHRFQLRLAVKVVILSEEGFYLSLRKRKDSTASSWDLPGGRIEHGEGPIDALIREVKEETGIEIISETVFPIKAWCIESDDVYVVGIDFFCVAEKDKKISLSLEHLSAEWIDKEEVVNDKSAPFWLKESVELAESLKNGYLKSKKKEDQGLNVEKGTSFAIEGIDGVGKTTQALELVNRINEKKNQAFYTKVPQGCDLGEKIMELANHTKGSPQVEMMAFLLSNAIFYKEIVIPRMDRGEIVVFDRWTGSFMNYFSLIFNLCCNSLNELNDNLMGGHSPDKVILLDAPVEVAMERLKKKKNLSKYDKVDKHFMENQRRGFLKLAKANDWEVIDGSKSISTIQNEIVALIKPFL